MIARENIRNVAIVAHVDHGKTTLVDHMLRQAGIFRSNEAVTERVMDSNDLEREKGITILAKNTAVTYQGKQINIIDTPGHADFGGEVERGLRLVDGVILLVDAAEGPLPQTRFVLSKALGMGLKTVLVINKIDRQDAASQGGPGSGLLALHRPGRGRHPARVPGALHGRPPGAGSPSLEQPGKTLEPLFDAILSHISPPPAPTQEPLQLLVANLDYDDYVGRLAVGRVQAGRLTPNMPVAVVRDGGKVEQGKIVKLYGFQGLKRTEIADAGPGEIVSIAGIEAISIGDTIADVEKPVALPRITVDEPTMMMIFKVNDGPLAGKEGKYVTSPQPARAPVPRGLPQRVHPRGGHRDAGRLPRGGPWRAPARGHHRDDAPRGLRADGLQPGAGDEDDRRRAARADGADGLRRARGQRGRGDGAPGASQGPHGRT